jgi:uncharacterized damage-inducible protein DinB
MSATTQLSDAVRSSYDYSAWATARVLDAAASLPPDAFVASGDGAFGSVRDTLVHIVWAQWLWLARWQASPPVAPAVNDADFDPETFPDVAAIRARWAEVERATQAFLAGLTDGDLDRVVTYVNSRGETWAYPLWQQLIHQVNHATQHRSEVAALLTRYGRSPGWLDFLVYFDELGGTRVDAPPLSGPRP